ncbi:MAG: nascent polypeptide-associated complex protein [Nanobdellota archaeon]
MMMPGMNSRQMKQAMKKMGVEQESLDAEQVIIRLADKDIIITDPDVAKVHMMGQETFQISGGEFSEQERQEALSITDEDITTIVDQTGVSKDQARRALENTSGDIAQAIMDLQEQEE